MKPLQIFKDDVLNWMVTVYVAAIAGVAVVDFLISAWNATIGGMLR